MPRIAAALLGLLVAIGPAVGIPGVVAADAASSAPTVMTPAAGATVPRPFTGPVRIDFTNASPGTWTVLVTDAVNTPGGRYYRSPTTAGYHQVPVDSGTGTVEIPLDTPIKKPGKFRIEITYPHNSTPMVTSTFTVGGAGAPQILAPTEGQTVPVDYTGPVQVDFSDAPVGPYRFEVFSQDSPYRTTLNFENTNDTATVTGRIERIPSGGGDYSAYVSPSYTYGTSATDLVTFRGARPPLDIAITAATPQTFYPRVLDDYRDSTRIVYATSRAADVNVTVLNSAGDTVLTTMAGWSVQGDGDWEWDGRNDAGDPVPVGTYRVRLEAVDDRGEQDAATVSVTVASDIVTQTRTRTLDGVDTARQYALGCDIREDDPRLTLDCWGGKYADAIYRFTGIPRDAWDLNWKVTGKRLCCDRGKFIRTGTRPTKTTYRVHVGVTGWRAYQIRSVAVTYKHKQRR